MVFESKNAKHQLKTQKFTVQFHPGPKRNEAGDQFGVLDTAEAAAAHGMTEDEVVKLVKGSVAFKEQRIGHDGIWLQTARVAAENNLSLVAMEDSFFNGMSEEQLRAFIAASKVAVPGEGVKKADLVAIAAKCHAGLLKPGDVPEIEAKPAPAESATEVEQTEAAEATTAKAADKKNKKKK